MDNNLNQQQITQPQMPVTPAQAAPVQQTVPIPQTPIQEPPKTGNKLLIILLVVIILTMILTGAYWFMTSSTKKAQEQKANAQFTKVLSDINNELQTLEEETIESELTDVDEDLNNL